MRNIRVCREERIDLLGIAGVGEFRPGFFRDLIGALVNPLFSDSQNLLIFSLDDGLDCLVALYAPELMHPEYDERDGGQHDRQHEQQYSWPLGPTSNLKLQHICVSRHALHCLRTEA